MQDPTQWLEALGLSPSEIPVAVILEGTWWEKAAYENRTQHLTNTRELNFPGWVLGTHQGANVLYVCAYGAPKAVEPVHVLAALGTKRAIQIGSCGSLESRCRTGDIIVPSRAEIGEGASQYYGGFDVALASKPLQARASELLGERGMTVHDGHHLTTSALFAQPREVVERWSDAGYSSVDMETSAVYTAASHFGMEAVAMLYVWDELLAGRGFLDSFSEDEQRRQREANEATFAVALQLAREAHR